MYLTQAVPGGEVEPGAVAAVQSFGDYQNVYPDLAARVMVKKAGELASVNLRSNDLRRHAVAHTRRFGTPIKIVSKVILRHAHLSMTQLYLGKVTDVEAMRWIENLYA